MFALWPLWRNWSQHDCLTLLRHWLLLCFLLPTLCCGCCCDLSHGIHNNSSSSSGAKSPLTQCCCTALHDQSVVIFNFLDSLHLRWWDGATRPEQGYNELKKSQQQEIELVRHHQMTTMIKWLYAIFKQDRNQAIAWSLTHFLMLNTEVY